MIEGMTKFDIDTTIRQHTLKYARISEDDIVYYIIKLRKYECREQSYMVYYDDAYDSCREPKEFTRTQMLDMFTEEQLNDIDSITTELI